MKVKMRPLFFAAFCLISASCRDGGDPVYVTPRGDFQREGAAIRLTYSEKDDRTPFWNAAGDSIYYVAASFDPLPGSFGLLARIDRERGVVSPAIEAIQVGAVFQPWYLSAAATRDFKMLVTLQVDSPLDTFCITTSCHKHPPVINTLTPTWGTIRVQSITATRPFNEHVLQLRLPPSGVNSRDAPELIRPTLSPDSQRVAFGDLQNIIIWHLPTNRVDTLHIGASWLAWSPDGAWLAYTGPGNTMNIIHPDGTGLRVLGVGIAPAWTPDGKALVATRVDALWRMNIDGTGVTPIPNTTFGYEPTVSPDGKWVAFAKMNEPWNHDIWLTKMP